MAKSRKTSSAPLTIAGLTTDQWKHHMDVDEDWTERLEGIGEPAVREVLGALEHADADVRALAASLAYGIGAAGLGGHAAGVVARLADVAERDPKAKVRNRARVVHESLAGEVERAAIRREHPWLEAYASEALSAAEAAIDDPREAVRLQVYLWWTSAVAVSPEVRPVIVAKLAAGVERETDDVVRRAAQLAHAHLAAG
jgi:F0F1-type ATP synthase membrane subunit c/vacuolar-type H+-ATPase subunit K